MVRPGATTRKPRLKRGLVGWRTAFTVCQAMSMAITVVLPAPVASFSARRLKPGFACSLTSCRRSRKPAASRPALGATSVSQMATSAASNWQKNGRMALNSWCRQCFSSRAVSAVTRHCASGSLRQASTCRRTPLMASARSYCWLAVLTAAASASRSSWRWPRRRFLGFGTAAMNDASRRLSICRLVGCRLSSSSQCLPGYS